ncbi:hypothetical protein T481_02920 [Enterococcus faecalis PF3]|nr:hypothetical protein T481_02920 [Enterococcus faecalis PF3]
MIKMDLQYFARKKMRNVNTISPSTHQEKKPLLRKMQNGCD